MKIKTNLGRDARDKKTTPEKKPVRRKKTALNQKTGLSVRNRISAVFQFLCRAAAPVLLTAFVFISVIFALRSDAFNLGDVSISGCRHQDAGSLEDIIRGEFPANVLRINLDKARQRLEKETWVKHVEIRRVLPSFLILRVEEREPAVLLELGGVKMMADDEGVMLGIYEREFGKIESPIFRGFDGKNPAAYTERYEENAERIKRGIAMLSEIAEGMPQAVLNISEVDVAESGNIKIMMDNDPVEISMGSENYLKRFRSFVDADPARRYQELRNQGIQVAQIDLSNDGQIVFKNSDAVARERAMKLGSPVNR